MAYVAWGTDYDTEGGYWCSVWNEAEGPISTDTKFSSLKDALAFARVLADQLELEVGGRCEAGIITMASAIAKLPACDKRARWMVAGALLCGGCKRAALANKSAA